jgi:hypothetical protein
VVKSQPAAPEVFANARVRDVRIRGDVAGVDLVQPGQTEAAATLAAVKRDGKWYLQDMPDEKVP